jgi:4-amino-4-deoxy-L-arabinose transferase-like glycosyltransferase
MFLKHSRHGWFWRSAGVWVALFAVLLVVYLLTLTPGVLGGDVGELQFVPYILGMAHPTGTPFYCLLGKLWTMLPLGPSVAWRMNLLSAVLAGLAIVVVYQLVRRLTGRSIPALAAALSLALGATFWEQATMADKYAFNALLVALVLYLVLYWGETRSPVALNLLVLTYGLSLTHHRTMALFAPLLLGYVWWQERGALWRDWRRLLRLVILFLAPLLFYLYLPWAESRNLPPGTWHPRTLQDWYHYIMDTGQIGYLYVDPADLGERLLFFARTLQRDFTWPGVLLGLVGLAWQLRRRWPDAVFLLVAFGLQGFLAANHHLPRQWTFFIPSFLIFAVWLGEGLGAIWRGLERFRPGNQALAAGLGATLALGMLALPLVSFPGRYGSFRAAHDGAGVLDVWRQAIKQGDMGDRLGSAIAGVEPDATIVGDWEQATPLWYFQQVEGWRPDVQIVYPVERLAEAAASGRPLYIARNYPGLADRWHPFAAGPLVALHAEPTVDLPAGTSPLGIQLGESFELAGFAYGQTDFHPAAVVPLTLYWRAIQAPAYDYSVSLRLLDGAGSEVYKVDSQNPVLGTYPTSRWSAGEVVGDYYEIQLPPDLPPGTYRWGAILYRMLPEGGWENLNVAGTGTEMAMGGSFDVPGR